MALVAGVDSSTQSCKVLIVDSGTGRTIRTGRAPHPHGTEVHPSFWWDALLSAISDAGGLADVSAISIAGQQHGMVLLDADGVVIRDALLWNDTRSAGSADALVAELGAAGLADRSGSVPVASFTITKLRWVRDNEPANAARVAAVALPHDWLSWRLRGYGPTGGSPLGPDLEQLATDRSDASGTGYWSPRGEAYDLDLFAAAFGRQAREAGSPGLGAGAGGPAGRHVVLPRVAAPSDIIGTVHAGQAGGRKVVVGAGAGDNAAGALGLGATDGDMVISLGTSGTVFASTPAAANDPSGTVAGFADAGGRFLPIAVTLNAARVLSSVAGLLGTTLDGLAELALAAQPGSGGVVLVPYFEGERTPNLPLATASFHGLSIASTTRENIARAAIEGMLCGLADGLDAVAGTGAAVQRLLLIGGAAQSAAVQAVAGQVFSTPVTVPEPGEYVARGAAVQAAWALSGTRPGWDLGTFAAPVTDHRPEIREQYGRVAVRCR
ncbi:FGGY family carbohydrate kinase [Arthrobacter sp. SDTb3-6]|uniref:FGGY family carbohydrate kinase n=1 Tax=Arthrobacter sp. SDTb3-6 TaxID=2713571 RepID=UPI00159D4700|nr:FGGY family carbohydrate kinase [Arthrobacter sp. SDTb3-6]NVM97264.1 xylulose kinase [Arthrobacter sp. SDTb3-6]